MNVQIIREAVRRSGMTCGQLARQCGINKQTISNMLCGRNNPKVSTVESVCGALGIDTSEVFSKKEG